MELLLRHALHSASLSGKTKPLRECESAALSGGGCVCHSTRTEVGADRLRAASPTQIAGASESLPA